MADRAHVLIAERNQHIREFQEYFLSRQGMSVEFVGDGETALERARRAQPTLIIAEILIPKIDGLALCRRLRADPATSHIPVIIFSILAAAARASEAGASAFLRKPLVEDVFVSVVRDVIAQPSAARMEQV